ncbi:MAG TPA: TonB-dependent receptor plug domain-containing protein, partial [Vicinamibacterales bacterium]|nr:TonB-dependent receptor plug domain-containing protein [Vicinamibacterales bacterium]
MTRKAAHKRRQQAAKQLLAASSARSASPWVTVGALVASAAVGGLCPAPASAHELNDKRLSQRTNPFERSRASFAFEEASGQVSAAGQSPEVQRFDIAPGPLSDVLPQLARVAGLTFTLSAESIGTISSPGVSGTFTIQDALLQALKGTGVALRFTAPTVVTFEVRAASESVDVTGHAPKATGADPYADPVAPYKADRLASTKFTEPLLNTARTETVFTKEALDDKNATTLREALRSTAGVTLGSGEGGNAFGDRFFIRGFDARNDVFIDGVRDPGVSIRENFDAEQIEILRGPASSFAGRGTTGGALNIVTKEAQPTDFYHVEGESGFGDSLNRGRIDINKMVSPVLDVRLNGMVQYADVAGRQDTTDNRWGVAGNVVYHPTSSVRVTGNYSHTYLWGIPDFGVPSNQVTREPVTESGVPRDTFYG